MGEDMIADSDRTVAVYSDTDPLRMSMVMSALEQGGISFAVTNEAMSVIYPVNGMAIQRVEVLDTDAEKAVALIRGLEFDQPHPPVPPEVWSVTEPKPAEPSFIHPWARALCTSPASPASVMDRLRLGLAADMAFVSPDPGAPAGRERTFRIHTSGWSGESSCFAVHCLGAVRSTAQGSEVVGRFTWPPALLFSAVLFAGPPLALVLLNSSRAAVSASSTVAGIQMGLAMAFLIGMLAFRFSMGCAARQRDAMRARLSDLLDDAPS